MDKQYYYKSILVTILQQTSDYVAFSWIDTGLVGRTSIPRSSTFKWDKLQVGKSYAIITRTPFTDDVRVKTKVWDWVTAYEIDPNQAIDSE